MTKTTSTKSPTIAQRLNPFVLVAFPKGLGRWIPGLHAVRSYDRAFLMKDLVAGLVLTAVLIPVGMGYATAAGLSPISGLYASIVGLLVYAVFGPSRILVLGPDSALAALIAATVLPLAGGDSGRAAELAGMLAILAGLLCILAGAVKFGFITDLLSKPIRYGYLNGIALTVLVGQLPKVFGFSVSGDNFLQEAWGLIQGIGAGKINPAAFAIGVSCLVIILGFKRWLPKVPGVLIAVIGATVVVGVAGLPVKVVGALPQGLPSFQLPSVSWAEFQALFAGAVAIALISFADMSVLSRTFALRCGYEVDGDQELIALGLANVTVGFFQGFSVSSSASRTTVAEAAGAKTQLTGIVGAFCIAVLLIFAPTLLQSLPMAALGAVVISASLGLVEIRGVARLYKLRRDEFILSIVCFLGVALIGVIEGIFIAVGLALLAFVWRAWRPYNAVLARVKGLRGYHDITRHPEGERLPGLVLFRWDAPLFFANAETFHQRVLKAVAEAPTPTKWVVVAAEPVTDVDITAADSLADLDGALHEAGIELCFAEMKDPVKDRLKNYGLFKSLGPENFFPTLGQAVDRYVVVYQVRWKDWDE